jgi:hypothetical protein
MGFYELLVKIVGICTIEEFFRVIPNKIWKPLPKHEIYQSPCYPIIGIRTSNWINNTTGIKNTVLWYYCKLHPKIENIHFESIEHHCKYSEPEKHKSKVLEFLKLLMQKHRSTNREFTY